MKLSVVIVGRFIFLEIIHNKFVSTKKYFLEKNAILDGSSTVDSRLDYDGIGWYSMVFDGIAWYSMVFCY